MLTQTQIRQQLAAIFTSYSTFQRHALFLIAADLTLWPPTEKTFPLIGPTYH